MQISALLAVMSLLLAGCDSYSYTYEPESTDQQIDDSQYSLNAFGGTLYGQDRGEWSGGLYFRDQADRSYEVIDQNVHGIIRNRAGVFVFTGLAHLGTNVGYIYKISVNDMSQLVPERLGRLPGAPSEVHQRKDGLTTFLVFTGLDDAGSHYKCLSLQDRTVADSNQCAPPPRRQS